MPLDWPPGWPRTPAGKRKRGQFSARGSNGWTRELTVSEALQRVQDEVRAMRGTDLRIDTGHDDGQLRQDGLPKSGARRPDDPGAIVRFRLAGGKPLEFACDTYTRHEDNLAAIAKTIEAKRGIVRWGCATADREFQGYAALPSGDAAMDAEAAHAYHAPPAPRRGDETPPWVVLGVAEDAPPGVVRAAANALLRGGAHPDRGGTTEGAARIIAARDAMLQTRGGAA